MKDITQAEDPAFASQGMGKGVCIDPADDTIYAPCDAQVAFTFPSRTRTGTG